MSKALDPLRRLVVQFNARFGHARAFPNTNLPQPAPPHLSAPSQATAPAAVHLTAPVPKPAIPYFGQFQTRASLPSHQDGPVLLAHLNQQLNTFARRIFVPEPARVAAVNYACQSAGRPQMSSLLAQTSQRMIHHQPLRFASPIPHGFARGVGLSSTRGFCSSVGPAVNGPVKMLAQMYAKPLGSLPAYSQKLNEKDHSQTRSYAKKRHHKKSGEIKKRSATVAVNRLSPMVIKAFLDRAAQVEQQHQMVSLCKTNVTPAISTATAISLAKVAGKTEAELEALPKLQSSETCPTQVDMCFLLDASPLWHLDTMVAALHTDSLRAPKELNRQFIEDLLEITNAQYQHFLEVSSILQKLVQCPESREITLEGYELRVHFANTTLFDIIQFLRQLGIDPKSPHFDLEEIYPNHADREERYFPQASVNRYYESSLVDNETWDNCSSIQSSLMMFTESERCESVASFCTLESFPAEEGHWDEVKSNTEMIQEDQDETQDEQGDLVHMDNLVTPAHIDDEVVPTIPIIPTDNTLFPGEEPISPWTNASPSASAMKIQESTVNLDKLSSRINSSTVIDQEYFDNIRGFLDNLEAVHRHSERLFGSSTD
ncbi:hypothetical protein FBU30_001114 [Linnemannia zychae]|nr:hypothetical protein FBU30_001114 [Linnemannia zychae]